VALGPSVFNRNVLPFDVAGFFEPLKERRNEWSVHVRRVAAEEADYPPARLLCARRQRPRNKRTAEQHD
jgi:hypothetical protein